MSDAAAIRTKAESWPGTAEVTATAGFDAMIQSAIDSHTKGRWGRIYVDAMAAWALHHTIMAVPSLYAKYAQIQSRRTGDVSVTRLAENPAPGAQREDGDLGLTVWGRRYRTWRGQRPSGHVGLVRRS